MDSFEKERLATIQFSDVLGNVPFSSQVQQEMSDFDAQLNVQVDNNVGWRDQEFSIKSWPRVGEFAAVLLHSLRANELGWYEGLSEQEKKHPDARQIHDSLGKVVVGVINCAPRRSDHHQAGKNGDEFYVGVTTSGVEIYAQLPFFRGLKARNLLEPESFYCIPNEAGLWVPGEQFRSRMVTRARMFPDKLEEASIESIPNPKAESAGRLVYEDAFGNVLIEMSDGKTAREKLQIGKTVSLRLTRRRGNKLDSTFLHNILVVTEMKNIPENELGIYFNPNDLPARSGPQYVELVKRVSKPNHNFLHAAEALAAAQAGRVITKASIMKPAFLDPDQWDEVKIYITNPK